MTSVAYEAFETKAKSLGFTCLFDEEILPGDRYLAGRNQGLSLFTCAKVNKDIGFIIATDLGAYRYDTRECVKVKRA